MPQTLSTGLIIAGAYADKARRVLFAQVRDKVKAGELENKEVARAAAELNRLLFDILVNKLKTDKGDVVRVRVGYELEGGTIKWLWDTLKLEVFRRVPDEEVSKALSESVAEAGEIAAPPEYQVERLGTTPLDDIAYEVKLDGRRVGVLIVETMDDEAVVKGAVLEPQPLIIKRAIIDVEGELDDTIKKVLPELLEEAEQSDRELAEKVVNEILDELPGSY
ncbi:MAG: DUF2258 domain-containing protein [Desulfurococcales archaeon]|nr:DUF2258 domain-containing protein [Desulfurococcales archaeon]